MVLADGYLERTLCLPSNKTLQFLTADSICVTSNENSDRVDLESDTPNFPPPLQPSRTPVSYLCSARWSGVSCAPVLL